MLSRRLPRPRGVVGKKKLAPLLDQIASSIIGVDPSSPTVVFQAAFHLIKSDLMRIPLVGSINVKQARGLLHFARWLQSVKNLESGIKASPSPEMFLVLIGPAGTGKSTLLHLVEALIEIFG